MSTLLCLILKVIDFMINLCCGRSAEHETRAFGRKLHRESIWGHWGLESFFFRGSLSVLRTVRTLSLHFYVNAIRRWGFILIYLGRCWAPVNDSSESSCAIKREGNRVGTGSLKMYNNHREMRNLARLVGTVTQVPPSSAHMSACDNLR